MGRQLRLDPDGGWHHVMHRGSRKQTVFHDERDCDRFMMGLAEVTDRFDIECHAFALMSNHYHCLVRCPSGGLSAAMKHLNSTYAQAFNHRHGYDGHLFRGRFRSLLVSDDAYLVELVRYIHRNPVQAGMVTAARDYRWSSHRCYLSGRGPRWLVTSGVLAYFRGDRGRYGAFVDAEDTAAAREVIEAINTRTPALGSESLLTSLAANAPDDSERRASLRRMLLPDFEQIETAIASTSVGRSLEPATCRDLTTLILAERGATHESIASRLGQTSSHAVASRLYRVRKRVAKDPALRSLVAELRAATQCPSETK